MVYMVCFLCEAKDVEEARRLSFLYYEENWPGHEEKLEKMLPTPLQGVHTGELTHWMCFIRTVDESAIPLMHRFRDQYHPPMTMHILGPTPPVGDGESLRHKTDAARDAWLASLDLALESVVVS